MRRKHDFTVIKGGGGPKVPFENCRFTSGFITDTRLMGVLVLYMHWRAETGESEDYHQFFYFDAEEYGLETFRSYSGDDPLAVELIEQTLLGGLGGKKVSITEREARWLLQSFAQASRELSAPLAEPRAEYAFLLTPEEELNSSERELLVRKMCTPIVTDFQLLHYYLMRVVACDVVGASFLSDPSVDCSASMPSKPSTLCKNAVEEYINEDGTLSYLCEALIETDGKYTMTVLELTASNHRVSSLTTRSAFRITAAEAAMLLNRAEFITVYDILTEPDEFDDHFLPLTREAMMTSHENGRLFLEFKKNNDHVNQRVFRLNEDIHGLYFVSDFGQLILAAYTLEEIRALERVLQKSALHTALLPTAKYEFKEPVLYEFIQSDYDDFGEFLDSLK